MTTAVNVASAAARVLWEADETGEPAEPLSQLFPGLDLAGAYEVQALNVLRHLRAGDRAVGHKVGLTSAAMQRQMGVAEPDSGVLLDDMRIAARGAVSMRRLLSPRVEAEIAVRLGRDLPSEAADDPQAVQAAVIGVSVAVEVIDTRFGR